MTDLELNAIAEGIFRYLTEKTESPLDGIAVLGMAFCIIYDKTNDGSISFADLAKSFHESLIDTQRSASDSGTERMQ